MPCWFVVYAPSASDNPDARPCPSSWHVPDLAFSGQSGPFADNAQVRLMTSRRSQTIDFSWILGVGASGVRDFASPAEATWSRPRVTFRPLLRRSLQRHNQVNLQKLDMGIGYNSSALCDPAAAATSSGALRTQKTDRVAPLSVPLLVPLLGGKPSPSVVLESTLLSELSGRRPYELPAVPQLSWSPVGGFRGTGSSWCGGVSP
jgi:hypothetical protein